MPENEPRILGTAASIAKLFGDGVLRSLYGPEAAKLYDIVTRHDTVAVGELLRVAEGRTGPVLELGCGTGRLTFPFLEKGYEMVALDLSGDMLAVLDERLKEPGNEGYADRITLVQGDMTDFHLDRKFDLIVVGGASVWTVDEARRADMFARIREHLAEDGRLLVTLVEFDKFVDRTSPPFEQITVFSLADETSPLVCTFFDYVDPAEGVRSGSVLAHRVKDGVVTDTMLGVSIAHPVPPADLEKEVERAGLRVLARHEIVGGAPAGDDNNPLRAKVRPLMLEIAA
ncbi:class I SAM-dependent methyltransferase [Actinomadura spongiicola]|uniref:Class I SAM-dependent methyltransferase n=1 Tax=Actinomadura spongiicola TaxID=2303421 RepID=A0A372GMP4_9ACTN|nr:daptide-type RiPP biosynthesis methyltransferase [Actinomadura spongiicola]RFS86615.1 class I SAM-dependent methyltransferase [Actinomadura spongiicola]